VPFGVRLTYTTGWTSEAPPDDLKQAIINILGLKLLEVVNYPSSVRITTEEGQE
jgi:hypothetical protein